MLMTLCRWKMRLWLRALIRSEGRRPLFKICLLAWLLSLPAAYALIQHKAAAPWPPEAVRLGLLRWSTLWAGLTQVGLAVLLLSKLVEERQDAPLRSHPASWKSLLVHRLTFSVTGASMLFALALLWAFQGPLFFVPQAGIIPSALVFATAWTLQAFVVSVLAAAALRLYLTRSRSVADLGFLRGAGLAVLACGAFLLSWGGDWMLRHQPMALGQLGGSCPRYGFGLWMPFQALYGFQRELTQTSAGVFSLLGGMTLLSSVFLAGSAPRAGRALWPQAGGDSPGGPPLALWRLRRAGLKMAGRRRLIGHLVFKDLLAPVMRSYRRFFFSLTAPSLSALTLLLLISRLLPSQLETWMHACGLLVAAAIAAPGLSLWKDEMAVAKLLKPWLSLRRLFFCKALAWLLWPTIHTLLSTLVLLTAAWAADVPSRPFLNPLLAHVAPLSLLAYLMGWLFHAKPPALQAATLLPPSTSPFASVLFWAVVSWLILPPPMRLPLTGLTALLLVACWMSWRRLVGREEAPA
ncbi:MAG TPA: hypothetical protein VLU25_07025 [Acidobacteriota bacterium]|nr:hypothetical protein [Acidobacteriota bacterium]